MKLALGLFAIAAVAVGLLATVLVAAALIELLGRGLLAWANWRQRRQSHA